MYIEQHDNYSSSSCSAPFLHSLFFCYCLLQIKSKTMNVMPSTEDAATPVASGLPPGVGWVYLQPPQVTPIHYRHKQSIGLGAAQIVLGSLCIVFNGIALGIGMYDGLEFVGHGFWCGVLVSAHLSPSSKTCYRAYIHIGGDLDLSCGGSKHHNIMTIFRAKFPNDFLYLNFYISQAKMPDDLLLVIRNDNGVGSTVYRRCCIVKLLTAYKRRSL